jgi:hypothetical protein
LTGESKAVGVLGDVFVFYVEFIPLGWVNAEEGLEIGELRPGGHGGIGNWSGRRGLGDSAFLVCGEDFHRTVVSFGGVDWSLSEEGLPDVTGGVLGGSGEEVVKDARGAAFVFHSFDDMADRWIAV